MSMIVSILITFLVVVLILWLVQRLPVDGRIRQILQIVVIIIGVVALLKYLAVF
ncbi:MAG: Thivi_2564 family membrane protein [Devosia sp.]|nr:Thivi_2564 family membrane protein [Devosia sp.]